MSVQVTKNRQSVTMSMGFINAKKALPALLIIAAGLFISVWNAYWDSPTFDETAHLAAAYSYVHYHDMKYNPEHPPLIKDLAGLPLLFIKINFNTTERYWQQGNEVTGQWEAGRELLQNNRYNLITFASRLPIIVLYAGLCLFVFWWAKKLAGLAAGYMALILATFSPILLGHNHLVTTDVGIAAFTVFSFYFFIEWLKNPSAKTSFIAGLFIALSLLAKFTSLFSLPVFFIATLGYIIIRLKLACTSKSLRLYVLNSLTLIATICIVIYGIYALNTYSMPESSLGRILNHPDWFNGTNTFLNSLNARAWTRPIAAYATGIAMVMRESQKSGAGVFYFMGKTQLENYWYFPTLFLLKETLGFILLLILTVFLAIKRKLKPSLTTIILLAYILTYLAFAVNGQIYFGLRHLLPIFPLIYLLVAVGITRLKLSRWLIVGLLALIAIECLSSFPYYIGFYNWLARGPQNGYKIAADSNADWGQDLNRLNNFLKLHPEITSTPFKLDYFGQVDPKYYLDYSYEWWHEGDSAISPGWYILSATSVQTKAGYDWARRRAPLYLVGTSFLVYHIE